MARNKITDLRDHLFAQLERLGDDELMKNEESAKTEIDRAKAMTGISSVIVNSAKVEIDYLKLLAAHGKNGVDVSFIAKDEQKQIQ